MQKELIDGSTSFELPKVIAQMMDNEKVSDEYRLVTKYYSVRPDMGPRKKVIYLAYDSESTVALHYGHVELEHFERVWPPDLIVVFGTEAENYYKKHGYNTYRLEFGYDDLNYKSLPHTNTHDVGFIGTIDKVRWSDYYMRHFVIESLKKLDSFNIVCGSKGYDKLGKIYANSLIGYNDVLRLSPNMRFFEIPSNGAFMVVNDTVRVFINDYKYPLKEGKHYQVFEDLIDLANKIMYAKENKDEINAKAQEAKELILRQPLSTEVRAMVDKYGLR
jgi:spore maturation protein CgeB